MADRTVYGNTHSENGWRMVDTGSCVWVKVPGTNVTLQIREGQPEKILKAFAADFNVYVEPLRDRDSACWTATNSVGTSNHLSGTGMDLNWDGPPEAPVFRYGITKERAYPGAKAKALDDLLDWYEGMVYCGGYWSIRDWMHMQMGYDTYGSANVAKVNDFIARKIRADGFSTYKRGGSTTPPPTPPAPSNAADILARATGVSVQRAAEILPTVQKGLVLSQCTNVKRIATWLAQMGHESASFVYTEEIQKNGRYAPYIGRTWIQITWDYNYRAFSKWCFDQGLVPTVDYFYVNYRELADLKWAGIGPAWYWTVARPQINSLCDAGNFDAVTQAINGGQNGAADRKARYSRALAVGDQLLALISNAPSQGEDELSAEAERKIDVIYNELTRRFLSRSPLRHVGEGPVDTAVGFLLNVDGSQHVEIVKTLASLGHPPSLNLLHEVANNTEPGRQDDAKLAQAILAEIENKPVPQPQAVVSAAPSAPEVVYLQPPQPQFEVGNADSTGQTIGKAYDALEALKLSGATLSPDELKTLQALIAILTTKTEGAQE